LIDLNKQINQIGLKAREKVARLDALKNQKETQYTILQESFLKNQNTLDDQKQSLAIDVSMTKAQASLDKDSVAAQLAMVSQQIAQTVKDYNEVKSKLTSSDLKDRPVFDDTQMQQLRSKTTEVEEIGNRIDEILRVNGDVEQLMVRLGRCNEALFNQLKTKAVQDSMLKQKI
jgi:hypothetical protein